MTRKFCLAILIHRAVPHKGIMIHLDYLCRKGRKPRKEKLRNSALQALCACNKICLAPADYCSSLKRSLFHSSINFNLPFSHEKI